MEQKSVSEREEVTPFFYLDQGQRNGKHLVNNFKDHLRKLDPELYKVLDLTRDSVWAREKIRFLLHERESYFHSVWQHVDDLERVNSLNCIQTLKNFISERNEELAGCRVLDGLQEVFQSDNEPSHSYAFYVDFINILKGTLGDSGIYRQQAPDFKGIDNRTASTLRSDYLDGMALRCWVWMHKYPHGLQHNVIRRREENRGRILEHFDAEPEQWDDYRWHRKNTIRSAEVLGDLIELTEEEREAIDLAVKNRIPFGVTPYYVSLMDHEPSRKWDHAIRAQVIPKISYVKQVLSLGEEASSEMDFMKEGQTSPVPLVTRRYPMIAILKPYNSCAQICVYCQRNWEIQDVEDSAPRFVLNEVEEAINWFEEHPMVKEVLITGGDPGLLRSEALGRIMTRLSKMRHITRIRIGTRLPVVLPMRIHADFVQALLKGHDPPRREVCVVTHIEHPYEVTPELVAAVQSIRKAGMSVYNQQVFTYENSRRFETALLRDLVKRSGVDPYYTFNTKGKEETSWFRVPIARILQEVKEEARLLPGLTRTDEPVFNIPALGKNHLRAWQHHDLISISPSGERIYEFHPWEKNIAQAPTHIHRDVPVMDYMDRLSGWGEDLKDYWSIWYYF
ncbi:MAG: L-lysine 2,3-aminomutase [Methanomassiliicoccales archaeon PtaU1.Bin124]|nr:MAG: L-lysine 2,3-aminomutase [Methanomassiliicoccales archaeon PtaU1.Bin124]